MKTTLKITTLLFSIAILTASCDNKLTGKGATVSQTFQVSDFSKVDLEFNADVQYIYADNYSVTVQAQENVIERMAIHNRAGILGLTFKRRTRLVKYDKISVTVLSPEFSGAEINGNGNISVRGAFPTQNVALKISGSGAISIESLTANNCEVDISGSGDVYVGEGSINKLYAEINGSGELDFRNTEAKSITNVMNGSGNSFLWVTDVLNVEINGSGSVSYKGSPKVSVDISGSGELNNI